MGSDKMAWWGTQHNQTSKYQRNRENHVGKTLLQKEIEEAKNRKIRKEGLIIETPQGQILSLQA